MHVVGLGRNVVELWWGRVHSKSVVCGFLCVNVGVGRAVVELWWGRVQSSFVVCGFLISIHVQQFGFHELCPIEAMLAFLAIRGNIEAMLAF